MLWREIKRGPDGMPSAIRLAEAVAETIARDYTISPSTQNHLIRLGLIDCLMGMLEPSIEGDEEGDA